MEVSTDPMFKQTASCTRPTSSDSWLVRSSLASLVSKTKCSSFVESLQPLLSKQIWTPNDRQQLLIDVADHLLHPQCTITIATFFQPIMLDILERAALKVNSNGCFHLDVHENLCIAVAKIVDFVPDASKFLIKYLQTSPPLFERELVPTSDQRPKKKKKKSKHGSHDTKILCDIALTGYRLLRHSCQEFSELWDWSPLLQLFQGQKDKTIKWHTAQVVSMVTNMTDSQTKQLLGQYFSTDEIVHNTARDMDMFQQDRIHAFNLLSIDRSLHATTTDEKKSSNDCLIPDDLGDSVVSVCGVLLPMKNDCHTELSHRGLVPVASTQHNLHSLALAVSSGKPVLLEGPVGSGKTTLVEHLAHITGRGKSPQLLKVQLGDQTDSKALIGTYRCTDIPGEFVWQPGALTQAVTGGHWILLEDIDYAPMDVVSVLMPLLESRELSIPGHGDEVTAVPGFQLFATQRLLTSSVGYFKQHSSHATLLDQLWTKVTVEPLFKEELQQVIVTLFPKLNTVVDKLLEIFCMLSASRHDMEENCTESNSSDAILPADVNKTLMPHDGRLVSTRDLLKWCERIIADFDVTSSQTGNMVFMEAMDCFCASLPKPSLRLIMAEGIGTRLNLTKEKTKFLCTIYKPTIEVGENDVSIVRARLRRRPQGVVQLQRRITSSFAYTRPALVLLERVAACIARNEAILLVGETGTGKTSTVQYLAELTGQRLKVINMNQQSDSTDLLGGFKPVDVRQLIAPIREEFESLFIQTFSQKQNAKFLGHIQECFAKKRWNDLIKLMVHCHRNAIKRYNKEQEKNDELPSSGETTPTIRSQWTHLGIRLQQLKVQIHHTENALAFSFIEGTLVKALKAGDWVLLDEINLATAETLECLSGLLESTEGSVILMERGDSEAIVRHKEFRLFACMNPATDVGKKELPPGIRNRFTEFFVDELEDIPDLKILVINYLEGLGLSLFQVDGIVKFYLAVRQLATNKLTDGTGHRPHYSLRTLCRALKYAASNPCGNVPRSLYESFCLSFLTQLDRGSHPLVEQLVCKHVIGRTNIKGILKQPIPPPAAGNYTKVEGYWIATGDKEILKPRDYILTASVKANLRDLARIVSAGRFPVLIQGETSVGKTSLIQYLAQSTGNHCVRVNNHEHTDLQEYVGFYAADETGKLVFKEGVLVDAMRKGHWIILDELNLAPTDVLEALNRLLDDNRELFIPETQETVGSHSRFMLFATQNPPGQYGGRKVLSRAFRNRFVELHFDEIPSRELETILHKRCAVPMSYCQKMVAVMLDLQTRRKGSGLFAGKQGFMTLRDLFRWAERYRQASHGQGSFYDWDQHIADDGYVLIAGRVRRPDEVAVIQEVLEKHIKRKVDPAHLFAPSQAILQQLIVHDRPRGFGHIVWTYSMRRLAMLVGQALKFKEPVLLVGETGCGKTTICQLFAASANQILHTVNCHLHTETSDFLGGLRPVRHHDSQQEEEKQKLFEWSDGPLVQAMKEGAAFLIDEISLADDSVLERLNSVLEPERALLLAERGSGENAGEEIAQIVAMEPFCVFATMNPGGDFGKKELSPALRNRFTEIWCPPSNDRQDLVSIIEHNLVEGIQLGNQEDGSSGVGNAIMDFVEWFSNNEAGKRCTISIRDILSWVNFINTCCSSTSVKSLLDPTEAYIHGACLVFLDGLGSGNTSSSPVIPTDARKLCLEYLHDQIRLLADLEVDLTSLTVTSDLDGAMPSNLVKVSGGLFGIHPFYMPHGPRQLDSDKDQYALDAPTTALNAQRVLRGLQLPRAILLEGSPGVGKTSLVSAIAKASGHELVRINLSEQTDVTDLFGADLPVEGGEGGQFSWRDGPLLRALKLGHWVVLDELNLASQSVLEGLNACLDHRAEIYVPELGRSFCIEHERTRLFACQNPLKQGGGRKGLPRSLLNRFTQVYVEPLTAGDLLFISHSMYSMIDKELLAQMVQFNNKLYKETMIDSKWGQRGGPWEFNLRDLFRWCDLMVHDQWGGSQIKGHHWNPGQHVGLIYRDRLRTSHDKDKLVDLFHSCFGGEDGHKAYQPSRHFHISPTLLQIGHSFLPRGSHHKGRRHQDNSSLQLLHHSLAPLESLVKCIEMNWMAILVGPRSCGKTSLVHLLAQLTGHRLRVLSMNSAMDTTELLGGFEQADINKHWEQLLQSTKTDVMVIVRSLLLANNDGLSERAQALLASWSALWKISHSDSSQTSTVEHGVTLSKVDMLDQVVKKALKLVQEHSHISLQVEHTLYAMKSALDVLKTRFEKEGDLTIPGGGGKFEWVDGLLVQALKQGDWLLIDNVNFCSPSVLDRLNALLEPNGKLIINERGVLDGEIPTITPHMDFRLILTMDPRHGEISRAMRNRGVEIYILGESDGSEYDVQDLKMMLHSLGMSSKTPVDALMNIHGEIRKEMKGAEVCGLPALLHTASLTVQLMQHGESLQSGLKEACMNVFVRGQLAHINRQKANNIINRIMQTVDFDGIHSNVLTLQEHALCTDGLPSVGDLCCNATWAMIERSGVVMLHILNQIDRQRSTSAMLQSTDDCKQQCIGMESLLKPATLLYMEQATPAAFQAYSHWLTKMWNHKMTLGGKENRATKQLEGFALCMPELVSKVLDKVFSHPLCEKLTDIVKDNTSEEAWEYLQHYPVDMHCNLQHLDSQISATMSDDNDEEQDMEVNEEEESHSVSATIHALSSRLYLLLRQAMQCSIKEQSRENRGKAKRHACVLDLSETLHAGHCTLESLPHPVIAHLRPFCQAWDEFVWSSIGQDNHLLTEDKMQQVLLALEWQYLFYQVCTQPLLLRKGKAAMALYWSEMALHWLWVVEHTIKTVPDLLLGQCASMPPKLQVIIDQIHQHLSSSTAKIPQQKIMLHHMGAPLPLKTRLAAEMVLHVRALGSSVDVIKLTASGSSLTHCPGNWEKLQKGIEFVVGDRGEMCKRLMELVCVTEKMNADAVETVDDDTIDEIDSLSALLSHHGLFKADPSILDVSMATNSETNKHTTPGKASIATRVAMWPLMEHLALSAEHTIVRHLLECLLQNFLRAGENSIISIHDSNKCLQSFLLFAIEHTPANPLHLATYYHLNSLQEDNVPELYHEMSNVISAHHSRLWQSTATSQTDKWLTWQPTGNTNDNNLVQWPMQSKFEVAEGPAVMVTPLQIHCVFQLLLPTKQTPEGQDTTSGASKTPKPLVDFDDVTEVPLGQYEEEMDQLDELSRLLWVNGTTGVGQYAHFCSEDRRCLFLSLERLLTSMTSMIPEKDQQSWNDAINKMVTIKTNLKYSGAELRIAKDTLNSIVGHLHSKTSSQTADDKGCLPGDIIDLTMQCLGSVTKYPTMVTTDINVESSVAMETESQEDSCFDDLDKIYQYTKAPFKEAGLTKSDEAYHSFFRILQQGYSWTCLGMLEGSLLAPQGPVDPAEEYSILLKYSQQEHEDKQNELKVREMFCEFLTGQSLDDIAEHQAHGRVKTLMQRLITLEETSEKLSKQTAHRPDPPQFQSLLKDITYFQASIGSRSSIEGILRKLGNVFLSIIQSGGTHSNAQTATVLNEEKAWQNTCAKFLSRIHEDYPLYRDLWLPFVSGVMHVRYGLRLASHSVHCALERRLMQGDRLETTQDQSVEDIFLSLVQFPTSSMHFASRYSMENSRNIQHVIHNITSYTDTLTGGDAETFMTKLNHVALLQVLNHAIISGTLDHATATWMDKTLASFVAAWHKAEIKKSQDEEAAASLYKFKPKTHGDGLTDDEREEREFIQRFPSYQQDFADITAEPTLEGTSKMTCDPSNDPNSDLTTAYLSQQEMAELCAIHHQFYTNLVDTLWVKGLGSQLTSVNYQVVLKRLYQILVKLFSGVLPYLDPSVFNKLNASHLLMTLSLKTSLAPATDDDHTPLLLLVSKPFDIYRDANVSEAVQCHPLLETYRGRICLLLAEWPEHPVLKQVLLLIERILSFSVTSPLMKFVTGLELLLEKSQEWEANASRSVSIQEHLENLTKLIIQWRKLELRCWSSCLDTVAYKQEQSATKWWFHLYRLLSAYRQQEREKMLSKEDDAEEEQIENKGVDSMLEEEEVTVKSLVAAFQQFMESATIGQYRARLQMLLAFHCQMSMLGNLSIAEAEVRDLLWNLYIYYNQFNDAVQTEIQTKRKPIEKELKGFVKISRWNDINFWAMKEAVLKSHRTLHKFSKKFEVCLQTLAKSVFTDNKMAEKEDTMATETENTESRSEWIKFLTPDALTIYLEEPLPIKDSAMKSVQERLPVLVPRMTKLCREIFNKSAFSKLTVVIEEFTGEVITAVKDLQGLNVTKDATKEKRLKEAKNIQLRKRKALADLFKYLVLIGLSYRKGLNVARQADQDEWIHLPPIDLQVALSNQEKDNSVDMSSVSSEWNSCQKYFLRSVVRRACLKTVLANPSKELGLGNIDRCCGFTEHLMQLANGQRKALVRITQGYTLLQTHVVHLEHLHNSPSPDSQCSRVPMDVYQWLTTTKDLIDQSWETIHQYLLLIECCPQGTSQTNINNNRYLTPVPSDFLAPLDKATKGDDLWRNLFQSLKNCQDKITAMKTTLDLNISSLRNAQTCWISLWSDITVIKEAMDSLSIVKETCRCLLSAYTVTVTGAVSESACAAKDLKDKVVKTRSMFEDWLASMSQTETSNSELSSATLQAFQSASDEMISCMLFAVQNLVKVYKTKEDQEDGLPQGDEEETQDETGLQPGHLVKLVNDGLLHDQTILDLTKVAENVTNVFQMMQEMRCKCSSLSDIQISNQCVSLLLRMTPIMHQYTGLVAYYLQQSVASHKSTCKLMSVLLGIFAELATKGFCLPEEFSDELGGEGATEFEDIEGGGIEEGEGKKDVSDQIETEDQIEDVQKPGDEKEENADNQPDLKDEEEGIEMSDDFEGKLHDMDANEQGDDDEDDNKEGEEQLEKQMGDVDQPYADKLDERMWGDDEDEEGDEKEEQKKKKEEFGDEVGEESESQLVAKDDNQGQTDDKNNKKEQEKESEQKEKEEQVLEEVPEPQNLEPNDETEFNDDEIDPSRANDPPPEAVPEDFDLPEDLDLDGMKGEDKDTEEGEEDGEEENPLDIQTQLPPDQSLDDTNDENQDGKAEDREESAEEKNGEDDQTQEQENEDLMETGQGEEEEPTAMETDEDKEEEGKPYGDKGIEPQDEDAEEPECDDPRAAFKPDSAHHPEELPQPAENYGKSQESTDDTVKQEVAQDAGKSEEDKSTEKQNVGTADSKQEEGHEGAMTSDMSQRDKNAEERQNYKRRPGHSDMDRTMGSVEERVHKRLRTMDQSEERNQGEETEKQEQDETSDMYEHIKDALSSQHDTQTMDAASEEQLQQQQPVPNMPDEEEEMGDVKDMQEGDEVMPQDQPDKQEAQDTVSILPASKFTTDHKNTEREGETGEPNPGGEGEEQIDDGQDDKRELREKRNKESTIHTLSNLMSHDALLSDTRPVDCQEMETLRLELEKQLGLLNQIQGTPEEVCDSQAMWHRYESMTSGLARDLCEQLRLVLEPTKASKLRNRINRIVKEAERIIGESRPDFCTIFKDLVSKKMDDVMEDISHPLHNCLSGDFRTGKRINMRKVIPYIASGFRKDKIWLRRSKPSKRQYQILLAVDDSSSMNDNHTKQLAFESLAVISNALTWLEAGELGVCSFGESVQLLHPFHEQFTDQSGAKILRQFTFSQKKTKIAQLLKYTSATMMSARSRLHSGSASLETSQLLLVVSDGRGLFLEGMETVKAAVRAARDANVFLVFVVLDNPDSRDSVLDIKVPIFHGAGLMPDIQSYMEHFPFPFYIILRDINSLPETLCDALRQWFELVTAGDIS